MIATYPQTQGYSQDYSVSKRPLTAEEVASVMKALKVLRNPLAFFSLFAVFISIIVLSSVEGDMEMLSLMSLVFGLIAIVLAATSFTMRGQVAKVLRSGEVTVVTGYARRSQSPAGWAVGPITVRDTRELAPFMREGPATVEYVPAMKAAMSVNGFRLKKGAFVNGPVDLAPTAPYQMPVATVGQPAPMDEPPPPDAMPQQAYFCPTCGARNPAGARFCQQCAREMPRL